MHLNYRCLAMTTSRLNFDFPAHLDYDYLRAKATPAPLPSNMMDLHRGRQLAERLARGLLGEAMLLYDTAPVRAQHAMAWNPEIPPCVMRSPDWCPPIPQTTKTDAWVCEALRWLRTFHRGLDMCADGLFRDACARGFLQTAQWLHKEFCMYISGKVASSPWVFENALASRNYGLARWLAQTFPRAAARACAERRSVWLNAFRPDAPLDLALRMLSFLTPSQRDAVLATAALPLAVRAGQVWKAEVLHRKFPGVRWDARRLWRQASAVSSTPEMEAWLQSVFPLDVVVAEEESKWDAECPLCYCATVSVETACRHTFCAPCLERYQWQYGNQCPACLAACYAHSIVKKRA